MNTNNAQMVSSMKNSKINELEAFLENIDCLKELDEYILIKNIFDILKIGGMEIRHSNFLAWLLDPNESHGLGDIFLKNFLINTIKNNGKSIDISSVDIDLIDLYDLEAYRELYNIDLLLI